MVFAQDVYYCTHLLIHLVLPFSWSQSWLVLTALCPKKTSPTFSTVSCKPITTFWKSLVGIFLTQLAIKWPFSFAPHPMFVPAVPGENATSEISLVLSDYSHFRHFSWQFIQLSISQLRAVKLLKVLAHHANTSKEMLSSFIDSSIDNVLLQTNRGCTSHFLTSQTFLNFIS